ncbi:DnaJ domain-containing protein [Thalassotalea agarivorans]|uniref:DnaJ domain-containing protein n=1 Tax=Thalassotalea agarivorans TaxID=349064 RepID=A0A1I0GK11_THASX|nr:DnaJ domain-containing protein [Thalassotalea agarivorans]SET71330.1 DnaJ domain-containing protein [Thalassotalea agarivorans]
MPSISTLVYITIFPFAIGYVIAESRNMNFWKLLPAAFVLYLFFGEAKQTSMIISGVAFAIGYAIPHASIFAGITNSISIFIDKIRYKSEFDDLKRKQREAEEAKAHYERARDQANEERRRYEQQRRREEAERNQRERSESSSESYSSGQGRSKGHSSSRGRTGESQGSYKRSDDSRKSSSSNSSYQEESKNEAYEETPEERRQRMHRLMGLDPSKTYSKSDLKKQYRKMRFKAHPDQGGSEKAFVELTQAYEELLKRA